jgi:hypothetical protein
MRKYIFILLTLILSLPALGETTDSIGSHQNRGGNLAFKQSFSENMTYTGLMFLADGLLVKSYRNDFGSMNTYYKPHFKTPVDNCLQYSPLALTFAFKALGVKSESDWKRLTVNSAISYMTVAAISKGVKHISNETRPDHSTRNSLPSGHTAIAFAGATIFHKEYGHLSPWYSIGGYTLATITGISRIINNRHWASDVIVGAGVGIVSTDIGYLLGDIILKGKGKSSTTDKTPDISHRPSFVSLTIGSGLTTGHLNAPDLYETYDTKGNPSGKALNLRLKTGRATSFNLEGAYYLNDYIGIGGRLKAMTLPVAVDDRVLTPNFGYSIPSEDNSYGDIFRVQSLESANLGMIDIQAGIYASLPLGSRVRIGTKILAGDRLTPDFTLDAIIAQKSGTSESLWNSAIERLTQNSRYERDEINPTLVHDHDFMKIKTNNTISLGTGLSVTYAYKKDVSLRASVDYDYAAPEYTYEFTNRSDATTYKSITDTYRRKTTMNTISAGIGMEFFF